MRKVIILICLIMALSIAGCGVSNTNDISFDANKIKYDIDSRTGLCFAATASSKALQFNSSGLGLTYVPCTDEVLELIDIEKLKKTNIYKK